jgi:hypothetical protein
MSKITAEARKQILQAVVERYRTVDSVDRRRILDEFVILTGYHRKHAIRVLNHPTQLHPATQHRRSRLYDEAVRQALIILWEASDRAPLPIHRVEGG